MTRVIEWFFGRGLATSCGLTFCWEPFIFMENRK
jgi:hypothetical protein